MSDQTEIPSLIPETAREALEQWDAGESVFTAEMGGLGPGYEQCIHIAAFEVIRDHLDAKLPDEFGDWRNWGDESIRRASKDFNLGLSGAQAEAARNIAARTLSKGWAAALKELPKDRLIQVNKKFPEVQPAEPHL